MLAMRASAYSAADTLDRLRARKTIPALGPLGETDQNRAQLAKTARDLWRNNSWARGVFNSAANNVVGGGMFPEARVVNTRGEPNKRVNDRLEDAWNRAADHMDLTGKRSFYELQHQAHQETWIGGEVLAVLVTPRGRGRDMAIELVESERLSDETDENLPNGNVLRQGVELNAQGVPLAYHLWSNNPSDLVLRARPERVPVERVLHVFEQSRPGMVRGLSRIAPVARTFEALAQYLDHELTRARISSAFVAAVTKNTGTSLRFPSTGNVADKTDANVNDIGYIEGGMFITLKPGESMEFGSPKIETAFEQFVVMMLRSVAVGMGVSYELLARDYSRVNFSSARQSSLEDRKQWRPQQGMMNRQMNVPVWDWFTSRAALRRLVPGIQGLLDRGRIPVRWRAQGWQWVDPQKEIAAKVEEIRAGLRSPQDCAAELGMDYSETVEMIKAAQEEAEAAGVMMSWMGTNGKESVPQAAQPQEPPAAQAG